MKANSVSLEGGKEGSVAFGSSHTVYLATNLRSLDQPRISKLPLSACSRQGMSVQEFHHSLYSYSAGF